MHIKFCNAYLIIIILSRILLRSFKIVKKCSIHSNICNIYFYSIRVKENILFSFVT